MKIYRYISLAICAAVAAVPFSGCSKGKKEPKVVNEPPVPIIEQESVSEAETTAPITTAETFPDYPVDVPEIQKQDTGNIYEAEKAVFPENLKIAADKENFSGDGYITGFPEDGSAYVKFNVNAPSNQHYDISFNIASDKAVNCRVMLGGEQLTSFSTTSDGKFTQITIPGVFLVKGGSEITICPTNGNICLDHLKLTNNTSLGSISYETGGELVNKNAGEAAKELMGFLTDNYGKYIISGQYAADEDNSELDLIYSVTGKYPVIRFSNFSVPKGSYDASFKNIDSCAEWYRNGGISCVSWYWNSPGEKSSVRTDETDFRLSDAVTDLDIALLSQEEIRGLYGEGNISEQCYDLILDIDSMAGQLTSLKNKGVPVLWRPLPEGGGNWYWWGASGADAYKWLWNLIYTRMTDYFELDNLIWIWNGQSESALVDKSTYDIAAVDIYFSNEHDYGSKFYEKFAAVQKFAGSDKLIAISECGSVPDIDGSFRDNALWSFFGLWFGEYVEASDGGYSEKYTSKDNLIRTYNSEGTLTLDEYQKLRNGEELSVNAENTEAADAEQ